MCTLGVSFLTPLIGENALEAWSIFNFYFFPIKMYLFVSSGLGIILLLGL